MMRSNITLILLMFLMGNLLGQDSQEQFSKIKGKWSGTLTYTDYSDDIKQSTLKCKMNTKWKKNKGTIFIGFTEPNGKVIYGKTKVKFYKNNKKVKFDGLVYDIDKFTQDDSSNDWELVLSSTGKDNNKPALIQLTILMEGNRLSMKKEIKYKGTEVFFTRNIYKFKHSQKANAI